MGWVGVAGTVVVAPGVLTTTRVTPFDVTTVVVVRPSEPTTDGDAGGVGGAGGAPAPGAAAVTPDVATPGVAAP